MQKGRILLIIFFFLIIISSIIFASLLIFQARAQQKNKSAQKTAQITKLEISPIPKISTSPLTPTRSKTISRSTSSVIPTSIPTSTPSPTPTEIHRIQLSNNPNDYILEKVNEYRSLLGLSKVSSNSETCSFAQTRAQEISSLETFNHDGFTTRINNKNLPYTEYHEVTENIAYNTNFQDVVNRWIASAGHEENMRKDTPYVCVGNYGDYYVYEGWRP